jgi:hypothetical protein
MAYKSVFLALVLSILLSACGTVRMRYEDKVDGKDVVVEKSYPVGGAYKPLCYLTGIFLGGSCWFYLVMPTVEQKQVMREDIGPLLAQKLGVASVSTSNGKIKRISWEDKESDLRVAP